MSDKLTIAILYFVVTMHVASAGNVLLAYATGAMAIVYTVIFIVKLACRIKHKTDSRSTTDT